MSALRPFFGRRAHTWSRVSIPPTPTVKAFRDFVHPARCCEELLCYLRSKGHYSYHLAWPQSLWQDLGRSRCKVSNAPLHRYNTKCTYTFFSASRSAVALVPVLLPTGIGFEVKCGHISDGFMKNVHTVFSLDNGAVDFTSYRKDGLVSI